MKSADGRFEYFDKDGAPLPDGTPLEAVGRFGFGCRSGLGQCSVNLGKNAGYDLPTKNWELSGTVDQPTILPSINCVVGDQPCWHGYIINGEFQTTAKKREEKQ